MKQGKCYMGCMVIVIATLITIAGCKTPEEKVPLPWGLKVDASGRYFETKDGKPFFWLGETGWLLFSKLNREQAADYLTTRKAQGFNVIQVMVLHTLEVVNVYGDSALQNSKVNRPMISEGNNPSDSLAYDYWDHLDYVIDLAAEKGMYMALVPVWGGAAKDGPVDSTEAAGYGRFLAERYKSKPNIIWLNGGDLRGDEVKEVWLALGNAINETDSNHLMTFHPRGRTSSSQWFHNEPWLDFNMFQSGHKDYAQDTMAKDWRFGEDNWRFVEMDRFRIPVKPTLDGEPSYEAIPHGLHDTTGAYWQASDIRRYAYWSVLAGGAGFTYGHNAVMQMHRPSDTTASYGPRSFWFNGIKDEAATQMIHLKNLMESFPFQKGKPASQWIKQQGTKYDYQPAFEGPGYLWVYTWNGRAIELNASPEKLDGIKTQWYNPRTGVYSAATVWNPDVASTFTPEGGIRNGNDWVLVLSWSE